MSKNIVNIFYGLIIATFLLSFTGCGYKADPVYVDNSQKETSKK